MLGIGQGWDWNDTGTRTSAQELRVKGKEVEQLSELQTKPPVFHLTSVPDFMPCSLLVSLCEVNNILIRSQNHRIH